MLKIGAMELQLAQKCPRLLAYSRRDRDGAAWGRIADAENCERIFNEEIAGKFWAEAGEDRAFAQLFDHAAEILSARLRDYFAEHYFTPALAKHSGELTVKQANALAVCTEEFTKFLDDFLRDIPSLLIAPDQQISRIFHHPDQPFTADYEFFDGKILRITGKYSGLLCNPDRDEWTLCEFHGDERGQENFSVNAADKTADASANFALFSTLPIAWLLHKTNAAIPTVRYWRWHDSTALNFSTKAVQAALETLPNLFADVRQALENRAPLPKTSSPTACLDCRYRTVCARDWGE